MEYARASQGALWLLIVFSCPPLDFLHRAGNHNSVIKCIQFISYGTSEMIAIALMYITYNMPRAQDSEAMYYNLARKKTDPESCKNQGLEQLSRGQKKSVLHGFRETLENLRKINNSSASLGPDVLVARPG